MMQTKQEKRLCLACGATISGDTCSFCARRLAKEAREQLKKAARLDMIEAIESAFQHRWFTARQLAHEMGAETGLQLTWALQELVTGGLLDKNWRSKSKLKYRLKVRT